MGGINLMSDNLNKDEEFSTPYEKFNKNTSEFVIIYTTSQKYQSKTRL